MPFETYAFGPSRGQGCAALLRRSGSLGLTAEAFALMGKPNRVVLLYDREAGVLGLRPATDDDAVEARYAAPNVSVQGLFSHYGIRLPRDTVRLEVTMQDGVLCMAIPPDLRTEQDG